MVGLYKEHKDMRSSFSANYFASQIPHCYRNSYNFVWNAHFRRWISELTLFC